MVFFDVGECWKHWCTLTLEVDMGGPVAFDVGHDTLPAAM